jgi:hypothetical protein
VSSSYAEQAPILVALREPGPFWFDNLAPLLARHRWSRFQAECGIDKSNYGTARALEGNPNVERIVAGYLQAPDAETQQSIIVECLRPNLTERYRDIELEFYSPDEIVGLNLLRRLNCAMKFITAVRGAALAVSSVLSTVHILKPKSPDYDVSYSEPALPFSIFVGVNPKPRVDSDLRLVECILHECMHLQLTLIEEIVSLAASSSELHHSPWRQTVRPTRGVLHALYVFRVIQEFFSVALTSANFNDEERRHARRRVNEIGSEVAQVGDLSASQDLTSAGRGIVTRLQIGNKLQK